MAVGPNLPQSSFVFGHLDHLQIVIELTSKDRGLGSSGKCCCHREAFEAERATECCCKPGRMVLVNNTGVKLEGDVDAQETLMAVVGRCVLACSSVGVKLKVWAM